GVKNTVENQATTPAPPKAFFCAFYQAQAQEPPKSALIRRTAFNRLIRPYPAIQSRKTQTLPFIACTIICHRHKMLLV
ncbi:hypothetical protein, partial [Kingella kingae]|uniref:hypothetical protein n=1 Tax=Kingella kingae TaxID=504 RepID=UPI001E5C8FBF